jgi:exopolyphosphatase / guanosine-5'-triphosphate,3'-diphosphate pyrophosphatase
MTEEPAQAAVETMLPEVVAAVDLGSNSFHMIVARIGDGHMQITDRLKEMVRLGEGLTEDKQLDPLVAERALACLERFGQRLRDFPPGSVRAVGTNTLRQLAPDSDFLPRAEAALGHPIEVIAGREEARLIYLGVAHDLAAGTERRLVVDIGGGSTEIIVGLGFSPRVRESLYMGCVSMSRRSFRGRTHHRTGDGEGGAHGGTRGAARARAVSPHGLADGGRQLRNHQVHRGGRRRRGLVRGRDLGGIAADAS